MTSSLLFANIAFNQVFTTNIGLMALLTVCIISSSAITERPRSRVGLSWPKVEDWNWETIFYGQYRSTITHYDVIAPQSNRIRWENAKYKGYYAIQGHLRSVSIESPCATSY